MGWFESRGFLQHSALRGIAGWVHAVLPPAGRGGDSALEDLGVDPARLCRLRQVHGTEVVEWQPAGGEPRAADGVILRRPGEWAEILTADCVPLILLAPAEIAVVHAGWRGVLGGMARSAVAAFRESLAALTVVLGPHIGPCCYEVSAELAARFAKRFDPGVCAPPAQAGAGPRLDLAAALRWELESLGVDSGRLHTRAPCTCCAPGNLPSWRRQGEAAGRLRTVVGCAGAG